MFYIEVEKLFEKNIGVARRVKRRGWLEVARVAWLI